MRTIVRAFWGPRPEPVEAVADRWLSTLTALDALVPGDRWQLVRASETPTELVPDRESLLAALRTAGSEEDWSDVIGTGLRLTRTTRSGGEIEVSVLAGGAPEYLLQSVVIGITTPTGLADRETRLLSALVLAWDPDVGDVTDDDILDALEDRAGFAVGDPAIGRHAYLSARRAARWPDGLRAVRREVVADGVLVDVGAAPDEVVGAYRLLRDAGALEPLPTPMDRAVW
ncbi:hypothetical protein [Rhodococcus triatomae]